MHLSIFLTSVLAGVATASPFAERQTSKLRISKTFRVPLGDSINDITCWRALVWDQIADAKYADKVQYVGSQNSNLQNRKPKTANWDQHHEGHSAWLAIDIGNSYIATWMKNTPADIVLFMLGTNDVFRGHSTSEITAAYTKIVNVVDLVIPLGAGNGAGITSLNAAIPAWAKGLNSTASPIVLADCSMGFSTSMLRNGVHPNSDGDKLIASRVGPLLLNYIGQSLNTTA